MISIVLPAYYSHRTIGDCLTAIAAQTLQDFEVIVINSSPEEETARVVASRFPAAAFRQSATRLLPHAARNAGVSIARGELIVFTDPDCAPAPTWLEELVAVHRQGWAVVQGSVDRQQSSWMERGIHLCKRFSLLKELAPYSPWIVSSVNVLYSRAAWEAAGPMAGDRFSGDALLGWHAAERGYRAQFAPRALVRDQHGQTFVGLTKERYTRGRDFARLRADYEQWSRWRAAGFALAAPVILLSVLARAGRAARGAGQLRDFFSTLPVQLVGQLAWILGESSYYVAHG